MSFTTLYFSSCRPGFNTDQLLRNHAFIHAAADPALARKYVGQIKNQLLKDNTLNKMMLPIGTRFGRNDIELAFSYAKDICDLHNRIKAFQRVLPKAQQAGKQEIVDQIQQEFKARNVEADDDSALSNMYREKALKEVKAFDNPLWSVCTAAKIASGPLRTETFVELIKAATPEGMRTADRENIFLYEREQLYKNLAAARRIDDYLERNKALNRVAVQAAALALPELASKIINKITDLPNRESALKKAAVIIAVYDPAASEKLVDRIVTSFRKTMTEENVAKIKAVQI